MEDGHKGTGGLPRKRELISLGMWKLGRKHDSCLKIFGRGSDLFFDTLEWTPEVEVRGRAV